MAGIARPPPTAKNFVDVVHDVLEQQRAALHRESPQDEHPLSPPIPKSNEVTHPTAHFADDVPQTESPPSELDEPPSPLNVGPSHQHHAPRRSSISGFRLPPPDTPSGRTGPPRSISRSYSIPASSVKEPWHHQKHSSDPNARIDESQDESPDHNPEFHPNTPFRGILEYENPQQRERERQMAAKMAKRRESLAHEGWSAVVRRQDQASQPSIGGENRDAQTDVGGQSPQMSEIQRQPRYSRSMPHIQQTESTSKPNVAPKWNRLRSLLPHIKHAQPQPSAVAPQSVNITDELIAGGLSALVLRLWFERDERDHRRVPILFHRLRVRVSDSLHPLHGHKAVFRIECEYANGAVRWVVYRQLREFLSLHTHYALSNVFRNVETLPEFPKTSLPYFKFLKELGRDVGRADFARLQREALENYLIGLIRAVMWHPDANRLAGFLEISALMISLAQSGGAQYKAGLLRLDAVSTKGSFGRKATSWRERKSQKWCSVRESYLVVHEEMGELTVWDVFLVDSDFKIERPIRYYRQGLNMLLEGHDEQDGEATPHAHDNGMTVSQCHLAGSIKSHLSKALHRRRQSDSRGSQSANGHGNSADIHRVSSALSEASSAPSTSSTTSRPLTPMLDPSTNTNPLLVGHEEPHHDDAEESEKKRSKKVSKHTFYIENTQMRLKLFAKNERQMLQWLAALERVARDCHYTGKNRFDSFAPIRLNVAAQWLVDGRDYFWNLSRAILLATESIYIHGWWISPELQMRRPNMLKYRLDNLLERKAKEGVKIYIILYLEVSSRTTPTDSNYAKQRLTALHPNIMVQRSPSHFQTGTFYWAHHEKVCVIDQTIAFMGGVDLCFGRWDTPQHVLVDDPGPDSSEHIWTGKDYSNPRIGDFHSLHKPDEDMYDRSRIPRMPWHDVAMQVVGQPARDLARHFVQRWNYLLRIKNHTQVMPFLLPPPEFKPGELTQMGLTGTCELQITRSAGPWSMGTPDRIECSIQNAYLKAIQMSEHFVYIENQFFITSTVVNEVKIENKIGDALVDRIILAHREKTPWKCCVVIPSIPGFTYPVDHSDASAIRIIMECQNRTICRGPNSIFGRLRKEGIDPDDYIAFFSLRNWGKLRGNVLTTEQVYIHGKVCIVDDRLAIIGSANINERSQRGDRDSEIAAVIRDTDMVDCTMAGEPFKVGRFAHTLRVRLMREHVGVDVDAMYEDDLMASEPVKPTESQTQWDPGNEEEHGNENGVTYLIKGHRRTAVSNFFHDALNEMEQAIQGTSDVGGKTITNVFRKPGSTSKEVDMTAGGKSLTEERQMYVREGEKQPGFSSSVIPTLEEKYIAKHPPHLEQAIGAPIEQERNGNGSVAQVLEARTKDDELYGAPANAVPDRSRDEEPPRAKGVHVDTDEEEDQVQGARATLRRQMAPKPGWKQWALPTPTPDVDPHGFEDPVCDEFWKNVWVACAVHNTEIYRKVFHAVPDDVVNTWKQYKEFVLHHERLNQPIKESSSREPLARVPSETADQDAPGQPHAAGNTVHPADYAYDPVVGEKGSEPTESGYSTTPDPYTPPQTGTEKDTTRGRRGTRGVEPFDESDRQEMERLLEEVRGHLVLYPTRFLEGEDAANNFLFNADRLMPLPIYD